MSLEEVLSADDTTPTIEILTDDDSVVATRPQSSSVSIEDRNDNSEDDNDIDVA